MKAQPNRRGKAVRIANLGADFHANMPQLAGVAAVDRRAKAFIVDKFYDLGEYLLAAGQRYIEAAREQHPKTHFVFDFHVGAPALLGGTFGYNWKTKQMAAWIWTEQLELVDAADPEQVRVQHAEFMALMD